MNCVVASAVRAGISDGVIEPQRKPQPSHESDDAIASTYTPRFLLNSRGGRHIVTEESTRVEFSSGVFAGGVVSETVGTLVVHRAGVAEQDQGPAGEVRAVVIPARWRATLLAAAEHFDIVPELLVHSRVEEVERTFP